MIYLQLHGYSFLTLHGLRVRRLCVADMREMVKGVGLMPFLWQDYVWEVWSMIMWSCAIICSLACCISFAAIYPTSSICTAVTLMVSMAECMLLVHGDSGCSASTWHARDLRHVCRANVDYCAHIMHQFMLKQAH